SASMAGYDLVSLFRRSCGNSGQPKTLVLNTQCVFIYCGLQLREKSFEIPIRGGQARTEAPDPVFETTVADCAHWRDWSGTVVPSSAKVATKPSAYSGGCV